MMLCMHLETCALLFFIQTPARPMDNAQDFNQLHISLDDLHRPSINLAGIGHFTDCNY